MFLKLEPLTIRREILMILRRNQVTFGKNSFKSLASKIWTCLQEELESANCLNILKSLITEWNHGRGGASPNKWGGKEIELMWLEGIAIGFYIIFALK